MPARADPEIKARCVAAIRAHLPVYGPAEWGRVKEQFPEVSDRTFWRWVDWVRSGKDTSAGGVKNLPPEVRDQLKGARRDAVKRAQMAAVKHVPAAPSPDYMSRAGVRAEVQIDFLAMVQQLAGDAELLREFSLAKEKDPATGAEIIKTDDRGRPVIKNPMVFLSSIKSRLDIVEGAVRVMREIWDLQYMQRFYGEIGEIIVEELAGQPEIQERVIRRLAELNARRGMTLHAGMG